MSKDNSAVVYRPQVPSDSYGIQKPFKQGEGMPKGGFQSVFSWGGNKTSGGGRKVY